MTFDWDDRASVTVPITYSGSLNGLCGNYNKNPRDDLILKNKKATTDPVQFGNSWTVFTTPGCTSGCTLNCTQCTQSQKQRYVGEQYCGLIAKSNGPFAKCFSVVDHTPFFEDCTFDACQNHGHPSSFCSAISAYVAACQVAYVTLDAWRSDAFCRKLEFLSIFYVHFFSSIWGKAILCSKKGSLEKY